MELVIATGLGLAVGARHAFEPDHLAAVSTLVAEQPRPRQAALLGRCGASATPQR
jgi:high-affinity nickel permease